MYKLDVTTDNGNVEFFRRNLNIAAITACRDAFLNVDQQASMVFQSSFPPCRGPWP